jgi:cytochrome P450
MFANIYSKSTLQSSAVIREMSQAIVIERLLPIIDSAARGGTPLNILEYSSAVYLDFISAFIFGLQNGSNYVQDTKARNHWVAIKKITNAAAVAGSWTSDFPVVSSFLMKLGIYLEDPRIDSAVEERNDWCLDMVHKTEISLDSSLHMSRAEDKNVKWTEPVVYKQLVNQLRSSAEKPSIYPLSESQLRLTVASELMDHLMAGTETSGWTLVYIMHELSHRPYLQSSLRSELLSLSPPILYHSSARGLDNDDSPIEDLPSPRSIDNLPLLDAIVFETLRLHPSVPGSQPRVTPPNNPLSPTSLLGYHNIPQGIRVSAQAYSLHRNPKVFPDPEAWKPERWLDANQEQRGEMMRWFWAFGSGGNMCIGNHFGMLGE